MKDPSCIASDFAKFILDVEKVPKDEIALDISDQDKNVQTSSV